MLEVYPPSVRVVPARVRPRALVTGQRTYLGVSEHGIGEVTGRRRDASQQGVRPNSPAKSMHNGSMNALKLQASFQHGTFWRTQKKTAVFNAHSVNMNSQSKL